MPRVCDGRRATFGAFAGALLLARSGGVGRSSVGPVGAGGAGDAGDDTWIATWEGPPQLTEERNMPPAPIGNQTIRQVIHVTLGGSRWRFKFSNEFGNGPLTIATGVVARSLGHDTIDATAIVPLRFGGGTTVTIRPGDAVVSDEITLSVAALSNIAITLTFGEVPRDLTGHPGSRTTSYIVAASRQDDAQLDGATPVEHWYVLSGAEVRASSAAAGVVILGNSIADGRGSATDKNNRWPDNFARRLHATPSTSQIATLNAGIGGNALLRGGLGPPGLERLDRDVLNQRGVRSVIVSEGVNDVGAARAADGSAAVARELIDVYRTVIARAHARGMRAYGATMLPFGGSQYGSADHEAARRTINDWIRTSQAFDGVIDFDAVMRDPGDPTRLRPDGDSGDHLHPNERGYEIMAAAIPLAPFARR